nr:MAG TPA: hypothetical protein [Caudoviricetes sp.]
MTSPPALLGLQIANFCIKSASAVFTEKQKPTADKLSAVGSYCPFPRPITRKMLFTYRRCAALPLQE